jgi:hypothetical protein
MMPESVFSIGRNRRSRSTGIRVHDGPERAARQKPVRAGIDPRHLLSDLGEGDQNVKAVKIV